MKKFLIVLSALALVAGLALNASAACVGCKGEIGRVPYPAATTGQTGTSCNAAPFDFDGIPGNYPGLYNTTGQYGYCTGYNNSATIQRASRNMKLLFKVCDCPTSALANELTAGYLTDGVGIRMSILTPGVHWAAPNVVATGPALVEGVARPAGSQTDVPMDVHVTEELACADTAYNQSFGTVSYYRDENCLQTEIRVPNAGTTCTSSNIVKTQSLQSDAGQGYVITLADVLNKVSTWWIDVPPMGIDPAVAREGQIITLKVGLIGDRAGTICQGCLAFCECTYDIAVIGCLSPAMADAMRFPYVVQQTSPWGTGVAITNLQFGGVANPVANIVMTDATGTIFRASVDMAGKAVWAWDLDSMITGAAALSWTSTPAGQTPAPGFAWICVSGNFPMDGYSYLNDGIFGAGTLPRIVGVVCP